MGLLQECRSLTQASVQNRPTPRAVQVAVWVAVGVPAFAGGLAALAILDVVTRKWPSAERVSGRMSGVPQHVRDRVEVAA